MQREWCPSGVPDSPTLFKKCFAPGYLGARSSINQAAFYRENGAVAAHMDKSAIQLACKISSNLKPSSSRFSIASVASRVNKSFWPRNTDPYPFEDSNVLIPEDALFNYKGSFLAPAVKSPGLVSSISLPADQFLSFLISLSHMDSFEKSDTTIRNLLIFPSFSRYISFEDLYPYLKCHSHITSNNQLLYFLGLGFESDSIISFCSSLKHLTRASIERCTLKFQVSELFNVLKDASIEYLSLEGDDLGGMHKEVEDNEVLLSLSNLLKYNKSLHSLNLSYNNFTSEEIENLMNALYESDTTFSLESITSEESADPKLVEEDLLLPLSYFLPQISNDQTNGESLEFTSEDQSDEENLSIHESVMINENEESEESEEEEQEEDEESDDSQIREDTDIIEGNNATLNKKKANEQRAFHIKRLKHEQRLCFEEEESARRQIIIEYTNPLKQFFQELKQIYMILQTEKQSKIEAYCKARSGWSRLKSLNLRGNIFGDRGARAVKRILKDEIQLESEELETIQDKLRGKFSALLQGLQESRKSTLVDECIERRKLIDEFARLKNVQLVSFSNKQTRQRRSKADDDDVDNAPEVVMSNTEDDTLSNEKNMDVEMLADEIAEDFDWETEGSNVIIPILPTKAGMNSIEFLDLSSCGISSNGLKAIAFSLGQNRVLRTLILRNNAIDRAPGQSAQLVTDTDARNTSPTEGYSPSIASGFLAFADMLKINQTLKNIDLGYCQLQQESIICLACALGKNKVLSALNLEGNPNGLSRSTGTQENSLLTLLCAIEQAGSLDILNLSNNDLDDSLWGEEICALGNVITRLKYLHLSNVGLNGDHMMRLVSAIGGRSCALRVLNLARNRFVNEDGPHIGAFLNLCSEIKELNLDGNVKLDSDGLFSVLALLHNTSLSWLSCNGTAVDAASAIPSFIVQRLSYLSLSDIEVKSPDALSEFFRLLSEHGSNICFLSLWSRHLDMQLSLDSLKEMVKAMRLLLYGDFGVLPRFDANADECRFLEEIENTFSSRRVTLMSRKL